MSGRMRHLRAGLLVAFALLAAVVAGFWIGMN